MHIFLVLYIYIFKISRPIISCKGNHLHETSTKSIRETAEKIVDLEAIRQYCWMIAILIWTYIFNL